MRIVLTVLIVIAAACAGMMYACLAAISKRYNRPEEEEEMSKGPEKEFEDKIKAYLASEGCWYIKYWGGGGFTKSGIPDLLICCNGRFVAVEIKSATGSPSDLQRKKIREIRKAGGIAFVLYPNQFEMFKEMIRRIKNAECSGLEGICDPGTEGYQEEGDQ